MRDDTAEWLSPMLEEANCRRMDTAGLLVRASMPAAEAGTQMMNWLAQYTPDGARSMAVDWIRFGQLLREELDWSWYPEQPS